MNHVEFKYYPFLISIAKCTGIGNVLSLKVSVPKEIKDIYIKAFNVITNKNEAMIKHVSCKCKFNNTTYNSNEKWDNKTFQ